MNSSCKQLYTCTCVLYEVQGTNIIEGMGKNFELRVIQCLFYWNIGKIDAIVECSQFTKTQIQSMKTYFCSIYCSLQSLMCAKE